MYSGRSYFGLVGREVKLVEISVGIWNYSEIMDGFEIIGIIMVYVVGVVYDCIVWMVGGYGSSSFCS